ncbi:MAG: lactonase family protein [Verrucomicrobia bacterium]|nr:lactonase family protein [Verrucomicrobiota bacterium]
MKQFVVTLIGMALCLRTTAAEYHVYFGTYTGAKSKGIYLSRFDSSTGRLTPPELAVGAKNPSFLAVHPTERFLYAVGETDGKGSVLAFSLDSKSGHLTTLGQQSAGGGGPCHLSVDATGKSLLVANYGSGSVASLPVRVDGSLGEPASVIQHAGSSVNPRRQAGPHAHAINVSPDNRFALVPDLGLDKVLVYRLNSATATLNTNEPPFGSVEHGAGPRHLAFSPDGRFVYVINEMGSSVTTFNYDPRNGAMFETQNTSTLPKDYEGAAASSCAEIAAHSSGRFVYASNRWHDSIAVFAVDPKTGKLTPVQHESTQGKTPRHFAIDPTGRWLIAENQGSDSVVVFSLDAQTGKLKPTGQTLTLGSPVCAVFVTAK